MQNILHISDLHFGPHYLPEVGDAVLRFAFNFEPSLVVISGDLTHRAKRREFIQAQHFLQSLPDVPQIVVPGNHDVPLYRFHERILNPHGLYLSHINSELNQVHVLDDVVIAALDSTSPYRAIINGRIEPSHLDLCGKAFKQAQPDALRIVVAHHPLATPPNRLLHPTVGGSKRALNHFVDLGVDLVLGGHYHQSYARHSSDIVRTKGSLSDNAALVVQCGTTTSTRGRESGPNQNSFNLIQVNDNAIRTVHFIYDPVFGEFLPHGESVVARQDKRPVLQTDAMSLFEPTANFAAIKEERQAKEIYLPPQ